MTDRLLDDKLRLENSKMEHKDFLREWVSQMLTDAFVAYAMACWRPTEIQPPTNVMLICAVDEGLALMTLNHMGDWRTNTGQPHKAPRAWMPAPRIPAKL